MSPPVPSPCTGVCRMNAASGWCDGCLRSLAEIASWSQLDDAAKRRVWRLIAARRREARGAAPANP
jgi:uncharacterized protein